MSVYMNIARSYGQKYKTGGAVETHPPMKIKKHVNFQGLQISIETPKGDIRRGIDNEGKPWANRMAVDYGYIKGTEGKDGDQVDVFVGPNKTSNKVFIVDQLHHHMEKFDEHKCLVGFNTQKQALTAYHRSYGKMYGSHHTVGGVTELSIDGFKEWLKGGGGKKPVAPDVPMKEGGKVVPLIKSGSKSAISKNISEFHTGPTYAATKAKFGKAKADKQAIAAAMSTARRYGKAEGGKVLEFARGGLTPSGLIRTKTPGRVDNVPLNVPSGSYVIPADIPSAVGQGNTDAGAHILGKMFKIGPYGSGATGAIPRSSRGNMPNLSLMPRMPMMQRLQRKPRVADGGEQTGNSDDVPIIAAGGEIIVPPESVKEVGHGDVTAGHRVLDKLVILIRKKHIQTLKGLKPPKK